jgi:hypothetical protein
MGFSPHMRLFLFRFFFLLSLAALTANAELRIPAFTAYVEPGAGGARVSERSGITRWDDPNQKVLWFGNLKHAGNVECAVELKLPAAAESKLRLTAAGISREATAKPDGSGAAVVKFGAFEVKEPGYVRFELASLNPKGTPAGEISTLILDGPATQEAHFNLKPRRNAASVHLRYPTPKDMNVSAFYCEMTGLEDPVATYYMACGWHRGYFGMQVNSPTERRIIFSVWDSGNEAVDRAKVGETDRVTLVAKGDGVHSGDFGNEGTGGHSHLKYPWKTGEVQRFVVTAKPVDSTHTVFAGYWFHPEDKKWMVISSWRAPKDGGWLRSLYSFSENFIGSNGHLPRKALYGNQWVRSEDGKWHELTTASFSHDPTGKSDRLDRFMGVENGQFFLSHGGFLSGFTKSGESFRRPATGKAPADFNPPSLPGVN